MAGRTRPAGPACRSRPTRSVSSGRADVCRRHLAVPAAPDLRRSRAPAPRRAHAGGASNDLGGSAEAHGGRWHQSPPRRRCVRARPATRARRWACAPRRHRARTTSTRSGSWPTASRRETTRRGRRHRAQRVAVDQGAGRARRRSADGAVTPGRAATGSPVERRRTRSAVSAARRAEDEMTRSGPARGRPGTGRQARRPAHPAGPAALEIPQRRRARPTAWRSSSRAAPGWICSATVASSPEITPGVEAGQVEAPVEAGDARS